MPPVDRNNPQRAASSESQLTVFEFMRQFPDDAACLEWLWRTRFSADGEHAHCPTCDKERTFKRYSTSQQRQSWTCTACGVHLHPTAGTIFHKSSTSLHLWFYAMFLMSSTRCGISAKQVERELGVTYKTAWRICHLIRTQLMPQDAERLSGEVEADEMYVGGKPRAAQYNRWDKLTPTQRASEAGKFAAKKTPVFGVVQRGGQVRAVVVPSNKGQTLLSAIDARVLPNSVIYTDEARQYGTLDRRGYNHKRVHHTQRVYVDGTAHTNTIEGFWALVKGGLKGVYHAVSAKHLQGYLNEYAWRYNHRDDSAAMFLSLALNSAQECRSL